MGIVGIEDVQPRWGVSNEGFAMVRLGVALVLGFAVLCGCVTPAQREAAKDEALKKQVAAQIQQICSLPPAEREAAIRKVAQEDGMVLYCGSE